MKSTNIGQLTEQLDDMVGKLGLEKLSAEGPVGESAGVIADAGTTQPAEQEAARSEIAPAAEGAQSASNNQMLKEEVPANTAESKPSDADNSGAASSTENVTTATMVGDDAKVEDDYGSRQQTLDAPTTSHPADVNKDKEKYSADLRASASVIDQEIEKLSADKGAAAEGAEKDTEVTVGDRIGEMLLGKEASTEDKDKAVIGSVQEYLGGYAKTAGIVGDMTADALDALAKQAMGEEMGGEEMIPPEALAAEGGGGVPAEAMAADEGAAEGGADEEAAALAQAAEMIAAELGVSPEEVLEAAAAELSGGGEEMGGEMGGMPPAAGAEGEMLAAEGVEGEGEALAEEEAKMASAKEEELVDLRKQAEELKQLKSAQSKLESDEHLQALIGGAVRSELSKIQAAQGQE